jgi:hypothetical protein
MSTATFRIRSVLCFLSLSLSGFFVGCGQGGFSDAEPLPIDNYVKKPGDFLGNRYVLRAQIDEQIQWEKGLGRVLAVRVDGSGTRLPVFVPEGVTDNLHVGQRYELQAVIDEGGLIYVEALRKY